MTGHVFISHGSENSEEANALCAFIEGRGVKCWIAPRDVRPGIDYSEELQAAIEGCAAFVVLVTETANRSPYVRAETEMAFSCHKPIFPVRQADIKPAAGLALFLKIRHWTDAFGRQRDAALDRLALELQTVTGAAPPPGAPPPPPLARAAAPAARAGGGVSKPAVATIALLAAAVVGGAVWLAARPGPQAGPAAALPGATAPRAGEVQADPLATVPGLTPDRVPGMMANGEIDQEALRNALDEARNLLEQQRQGRDPFGEALSVPTQ